MTKKAKAAASGSVEVRPGSLKWLKSLRSDSRDGFRFTGLYHFDRWAYATDGWILGMIETGAASPCGPISDEWLKKLLAAKRTRKTVSFDALASFARTRVRLNDPADLFGVTVDRALLWKLLRKAPRSETLTLGVPVSKNNAMRIETQDWTAFLMPRTDKASGARFTKTVNP